jgi:hypothetical protein
MRLKFHGHVALLLSWQTAFNRNGGNPACPAPAAAATMKFL